jgi:four helix bundle protein
MSIALKEANETEYWLLMLRDTDYINEKTFRSLQSDCVELDQDVDRHCQDLEK